MHRRLLLIWLIGTPLGAHAADFAIQSHASIQETARSHLANRLPKDSQDAKVEVSRLDPRLRMRQCSEDLEAFAPAGSRLAGNVTVGIRCKGEKPWTLYVPAKVRVFGDVVVASRGVPRGARLSAGDIRIERRDLSSLHRGYLKRTGEAQGQIARRMLTEGTVLNPDMVRIPPLVERGQKVTIIAGGPTIQVRMRGVALGDAIRGERLKVKNLNSNRIVEATATGDGVVQVSM